MWIFCLLELSTTKTSLIKQSNTPRKKHFKKEGHLQLTVDVPLFVYLVTSFT